MQSEELAAVLTIAAHLTDHLAAISIWEPDVVVGEVGDIEEALRFIGI